MAMPNQEQIKAILQMLLGAGGPLAALILSYGVPADKLTLWTNLALAIVPPLVAAGWQAWDRTHKNQIASASNIPGVDKIVVNDNANGGAGAAAADNGLPKVMTVTDAKSA